MAKFIGRQQSIGLARETSRGTIVTPAFWTPKTNFNVEDKVQKGVFMGNYGVIAGGDDALVTQQWAEGDLELEVTDKTIGLIWYALFGSMSDASFNSVFKHTYTLLNSVQHPSLSIFMNDPIGDTTQENVSIAYPMAMLNSFEMEVALGELVKAKCNFIAKKHRDFTRQTASYVVENKFAHNHVTFKIAADESSLAAASGIQIHSLKLSINKNVIRENVHGTVQPVDILNRMITIEGSVTLTYIDRTYRDYLLNGTKKAVSIILQNDQVTIGTTNPTVQLDLPVVHFETWDPSVPNDDVAMQELKFTALYDVTNGRLIGTNTFVVNSTTTY